MKGAKTIYDEGNIFWLMDLHWEIFWDLLEMKGYDKEVYCKRCHAIAKYNVKGHNMAMRCSKCDQTYSPTADTIFANSKIWLPIWMKAIHIITENPNIKLKELTEKLDCTNVTACNIKRKVKSINEDSIEFKLYEKHKQSVINDFN